MIIGIIGSGGREHAICAKILESKKVKKIYCFPGNAGTNLIATNVEIKIDEFNEIDNFNYEPYKKTRTYGMQRISNEETP